MSTTTKKDKEAPEEDLTKEELQAKLKAYKKLGRSRKEVKRNNPITIYFSPQEIEILQQKASKSRDSVGVFLKKTILDHFNL